MGWGKGGGGTEGVGERGAGGSISIIERSARDMERTQRTRVVSMTRRLRVHIKKKVTTNALPSGFYRVFFLLPSFTKSTCKMRVGSPTRVGRLVNNHFYRVFIGRHAVLRGFTGMGGGGRGCRTCGFHYDVMDEAF